MIHGAVSGRIMTWVRKLQSLYSVDVLDTRFTTTSNSPPKTHDYERRIDPVKYSSTEVSNGTRERGNNGDTSFEKPRWNTREFYFYYLIFIVAVPLMFKAAIDVSKETHPSYPKFEPLLSPGWILGRKVDNSDLQYSSIRNHLPALFLLILAHPALRKLYDYLCRTDTYTNVPSSVDQVSVLTQGLTAEAAADARQEQRISFDLWFAIVFIIALHGTSAIKIFAVLFANYGIATSIPKSYVPLATWIFNVGLLFANEYFDGYHFTNFITYFQAKSLINNDTNLNGKSKWVKQIDDFSGLIPQWHVFFKFTILRMISFNMDYVWSLKYQGSSPVEKKQLNLSSLSERDRIGLPAKEDSYTLRKYIAYTLYAPLYLAGPILTFNDFMSQLRYRTPSTNLERTVKYVIRFLIAVLCMEVLLHYIYVVAIFKAQVDWGTYSPFELSMLAYFNLTIIWLKLLIPWRLFRTWALLDGIDPPENMIRCMSNNYSSLAFWRSWHRSFGRWTIRYIYAPLGGRVGTGVLSRLWNIANYLVVFTFVAIWHDINLRLLTWGWLVTIFMIPEITASIVLPARKWQTHPTTYRVICGIGAVFNILMMMAAALVGFAVGSDGLRGLVDAITNKESGLSYLLTACGALFVGSQIMFEVRQDELRRGVKLKC